MKVVVLGAGVIGVTSAWYLARAGHQVTVLERRSDVALETSFGNAGGVCPSFAGPWAAPGMPTKALKWMFQSAPPLKIFPKFDHKQWLWLGSFIKNCNTKNFQENKVYMQRIAHYSKSCLQEIRSILNLKYDAKSAGVLQIFQTESEVVSGALSAQILSELGVEHSIVDRARAESIEPALAHSQTRIVGGLFLPGDEIGDCQLFCKEILEALKNYDVDFQFNTEVTDFSRSGGRIDHVITTEGHRSGDAFVVALGPFVSNLLNKLDINIPVYPVKGYSITGELIDPERGPISSVMDEHSKVMITRLGNRLRAAGVAELAGFDRTLRKSSILGITRATGRLFPNAVNYKNLSVWCGFRPMTPDGPPKLGKTKYSNLFLNVGHGSNGWTQACGSSKIVADILSRKKPDIDISGLTYTH